MIIRDKCVICLNKLNKIYEMINYPISTRPMETEYIEDNEILFNLEYGLCSKCNSVQLLNLLESDILYNHANKVTITPLWREHYENLYNFIKENINKND